MKKVYAVIYLWRGERHSQLTDYATLEQARAVARAMRLDGWDAWIEERWAF